MLTKIKKWGNSLAIRIPNQDKPEPKKLRFYFKALNLLFYQQFGGSPKIFFPFCAEFD